MGRSYRKRWPGTVSDRDAEYLGSEMNADVYRERRTGKVFHVGSSPPDGHAPKRYEGNPSRAGYLGGKLLQNILGTEKE